MRLGLIVARFMRKYRVPAAQAAFPGGLRPASAKRLNANQSLKRAMSLRAPSNAKRSARAAAAIGVVAEPDFGQRADRRRDVEVDVEARIAHAPCTSRRRCGRRPASSGACRMACRRIRSARLGTAHRNMAAKLAAVCAMPRHLLARKVSAGRSWPEGRGAEGLAIQAATSPSTIDASRSRSSM